MSKRVVRLFDGFAPETYTLFLDPSRDTKQIQGEVTITGVKKGRPSQRLTFHQNGLIITHATITRHDKKGEQQFPVSRINHQRTLDEVRLHADSLLYGGSYTVTMRFKGLLTDSTHGIYPCYYEHEGKRKALVATQLESHHAREAFPCIDEPEAKATFDFTLASPLGEQVLGNTPIKAQSQELRAESKRKKSSELTAQDYQLITTFETTPRMSTYLLAFVYGEMQSRETKTKGGVAVRAWSTKAHSPESLDFGLEVARRGIEFFDEYYSVPYPLAKCDLIALPDFSSGAMENWGLITFREVVLVLEPALTSQSSKERTALVVCHELSHQWFGNLVTMKWWDDLWLNESFANVMEYVAPDALYPQWHVWDMFIGGEGLSAFRRDAIPGVQAVRSDVRNPEEINTMFDPSIVYAKGGRLMYMLINYIGEADFRKGLQAYFTKHAYKNTTGNDLWVALGEASNKDISKFMNTWIEQPNFPVVHVGQSGTDLTLSQSHFVLDPAKADAKRLWPIPTLASDPAVPALLSKQTANVTLPTNDFVRLNQGAIGHYIVHYTRAEHMQAIAQLAAKKQLTEAERLMLLSDSSLLARAAVDSFAATLQLLGHYASEDSETVWDIMALIIADARRFIDTAPELEPAIKAQIRTLVQAQYKRLGWTEHKGETPQDTKLRATILGLGVYAEHPAITKEAATLFEAYKKDQTTIPAELRAIVLAAAIRNNVKGAFTYLLDFEEKTANPDLKMDLLGALTATHSVDEATVLLGRLTDAKKVRTQDVDHWLVFLMRNRYTQAVAWDWLRDNWAWIEQTFKSDKSYDYFPRYAASAFNTRARLQEYNDFFGPLKSQTALARNIAMGIEELATRIAWIERDLSAVQTFYQLS